MGGKRTKKVLKIIFVQKIKGNMYILYIYIYTHTHFYRERPEMQRSWVTCHLSHRRPVLRRPSASGPGGCHVAFRSHVLPTPESGLSLPCSKVMGKHDLFHWLHQGQRADVCTNK